LKIGLALLVSVSYGDLSAFLKQKGKIGGQEGTKVLKISFINGYPLNYNNDIIIENLK